MLVFSRAPWCSTVRGGELLFVRGGELLFVRGGEAAVDRVPQRNQ